MNQLLVGWIAFIFICICNIENVDSRVRYSNNNRRNVRTDSSREYQNTKLGWKVGAVATGSIFLAPFFATKFQHRYSEFNRYYKNQICYNSSFVNVTFVDLDNVTDIYNDSDWHMDMISTIPEGLFVCPLSLAEQNKSYCCGPDKGEYCCDYWEAEGASIVFGVIATVIIGLLCLAYFIYRKIWGAPFSYSCFGNRHHAPLAAAVMYDANNPTIMQPQVPGQVPLLAAYGPDGSVAYVPQQPMYPAYTGYPPGTVPNAGYPPGAVPNAGYPPGSVPNDPNAGYVPGAVANNPNPGYPPNAVNESGPTPTQA